MEVTIRYFETVSYANEAYTFSFPMVVGPRFNPGEATAKQARGWSPDTTDVPDASRITPRVLEPGQRSGHDISLTVSLDAGTPLRDLSTPSHEVIIERNDDTTAVVSWKCPSPCPKAWIAGESSATGSASACAMGSSAASPVGFQGVSPGRIEDGARILEGTGPFFTPAS